MMILRLMSPCVLITMLVWRHNDAAKGIPVAEVARHAAQPVAETLGSERRAMSRAPTVFPKRVVHGVSAFMWDVHRPPHSRLHAVMT